MTRSRRPRASRRVRALAFGAATVALSLTLVPAAPAPCETGECAPTTCQVDLDCEKDCVCSQDLDESESGVCIPPV